MKGLLNSIWEQFKKAPTGRGLGYMNMNLVQKTGNFQWQEHERDDMFLLSLAEPVLGRSMSRFWQTINSEMEGLIIILPLSISHQQQSSTMFSQFSPCSTLVCNLMHVTSNEINLSDHLSLGSIFSIIQTQVFSNSCFFSLVYAFSVSPSVLQSPWCSFPILFCALGKAS